MVLAQNSTMATSAASGGKTTAKALSVAISSAMILPTA